MILLVIEGCLKGVFAFYYIHVFDKYFSIDDKRDIPIFIYIIYATFIGLTCLLPNYFIAILSCALLYFCLSLLCEKKEITICILQTIMFVSYIFISQYIATTFLMYVTSSENRNILVSSPLYSYILVLLNYILCFSGIFFVDITMKKNGYLDMFSKIFMYKKYSFYLIIIILTFLPITAVIVYNNYSYDIVLLLCHFVQILGTTAFIAYFSNEMVDKERYIEKCTSLEVDNKSMACLIDGVKTIKHDFGNTYQAINGYLCRKDYDKLEAYVSSIMKEYNILSNMSLLNNSIFDDSGIYGIVGTKHFYANSIGIVFDIDVPEKVSKINFPKLELCKIFGILLDNAIEATSKAVDKYIKLSIHYVDYKDAFVIKISNTFNTNCKIEISKIFDKGYSSKIKKSGIGLWEVKKIINSQSNSQIYASIENNVFVQNIIIEN